MCAALNPQLCQQVMTRELTKFLELYNSLDPARPFQMDACTYGELVRVIGHFISREYQPDRWSQQVVRFPGAKGHIDLSRFHDTPYTQCVRRFLDTLRSAFDSNLDAEMVQYLNTTPELTPIEKELCLEFYSRFSALNKAMYNRAFESTQGDVVGREAFQSYDDVLRRYDEFVKLIAQHESSMRTMQKFDRMLRFVAATKKHPEVAFTLAPNASDAYNEDDVTRSSNS